MPANPGKIREAVLYGGTGQAKVVRPILEQQGIRIIAVFDDTPDLQPPFPDVDLYAGREAIDNWLNENRQQLPQVGFSITIGNPHGEVRNKLQSELKKLGLQPLQVIHPSAVIESNAVLGEGCQIMAGSIVGAEARIGQACIINTRASVDHECVLEEGVELAPGVTLCGLVTINKYAWVGAGATVLPRVTIGSNAIVGAGSLVRNDVGPGETVIGIPARKKG